LISYYQSLYEYGYGVIIDINRLVVEIYIRPGRGGYLRVVNRVCIYPFHDLMADIIATLYLPISFQSISHIYTDSSLTISILVEGASRLFYSGMDRNILDLDE
jgi:hypothetical protein